LKFESMMFEVVVGIWSNVKSRTANVFSFGLWVLGFELSFQLLITNHLSQLFTLDQ